MFGSDFWLDQVIPNVNNPRERYMGFDRVCDVLVIPDVRYQNEISRVNDAGGQLWKINRSVKGHTTGHASEGELVARWDRVIDNNGTKNDLKSDVKNAFNKIANQIINDRVTKVFQ
jgi:dephospho-CoA kinase